MSVLIKGMEMPCACVFCELFDGDLWWCRGAKKEVPYSPEDKRAKFCPLIEVPPHGRLIDADALWQKIKSNDDGLKLRPKRESIIYDAGFLAGYRAAAQIMFKMPTIIEADKEDGE